MYRTPLLTALIVAVASSVANVSAEEKPHVVFVVGTPHYNPAGTMSGLAKQIEETFGWSTTIVQTDYNPEQSERGIPGLEALEGADLVVLYLRFLTLPPEQFAQLEAYLTSGRPLVAFRTTSHSFRYPDDSPLAEWNEGFGLRVMGTKYFPHSNEVTQVTKVADHPVLTGVQLTEPREATGTLYPVQLPESAVRLLAGTSEFRESKVAAVEGALASIDADLMGTDDVVWLWQNEWGGRVFCSTIGHPVSFRDPNWVRLFINGMHWATELPIPKASTPVVEIDAGTAMNTAYQDEK